MKLAIFAYRLRRYIVYHARFIPVCFLEFQINAKYIGTGTRIETAIYT